MITSIGIVVTSIGHRDQRDRRIVSTPIGHRDHRIVITCQERGKQQRRWVSRFVDGLGYEVVDGHAETDHVEDQRDSPPEDAPPT